MVPEMYDLEALRWAMQAVIAHFQALSLHGLILDLRHNTGGGSFEFALTMASYFKGPSFAFIIEERLQKRQFHVPPLNINVRRFDGPLVVLQDRETAGYVSHTQDET
jgi:C-terminal processing protease CtpA/Prc